jgi:methylated-DNA-[protein]-cysteine S-methyltransferase
MNGYQHSFPFSTIEIHENDQGIIGIFFKEPSPTPLTCPAPSSNITRCIQQLEEYFAGTRQIFDVPAIPSGTSFQLRVWRALTLIPYGMTKTYLEVALMLGSRTLSRAVGQACNKNPLPILIPCHRVVGSNGDPTGYQAGLEKKLWMLDLEKQAMK